MSTPSSWTISTSRRHCQVQEKKSNRLLIKWNRLAQQAAGGSFQLKVVNLIMKLVKLLKIAISTLSTRDNLQRVNYQAITRLDFALRTEFANDSSVLINWIRMSGDDWIKFIRQVLIGFRDNFRLWVPRGSFRWSCLSDHDWRSICVSFVICEWDINCLC